MNDREHLAIVICIIGIFVEILFIAFEITRIERFVGMIK
jgi:hypothetical protein